MTQITKQSLQNFRKDFDTATSELAKKYGIKIDLGGIKYTDNDFTAKFTATSLSFVKSGVPGKAEWHKDYRDYAKIYGLESIELGAQVMFDGELVTVCGFRPRARLNLVIQRPRQSKFTVVSADDFTRKVVISSKVAHA